MAKIFQLPEEIISKIAAGEVIERPVYAVKELVENSLDAGATTISVHIEESGLKNITVIDDGEGMSKEDIETSFKLHTTSKISSIEQLHSINTHGFRGEALSSIASISRIHIRSKRKNDIAGTSIEVIEGEIKKIAPFGMPYGTNISVFNLFYPVPARKKFLKSSRTEFRHIVELMTQFAIAHPEISFSLHHNKKKIFDLPRTTTALERIKILFGENIFSQLLPVMYEDSYITISGFLTKPQVFSSTTQKQYVYINKRKVTDKIISLAVKNAYGTLLESTAYPIFFLSLHLPFEFVDVNVHPRKEQVRFVDTQRVYDAVHKAIAQTLEKNNLLFLNDDTFGIGLSDGLQKKRFGYTKSLAGKLLKENQTPWDIRPIVEIANFSDIVQMHNLYIVSSTKSGVVFVDQHAAHERILYEQFWKAFKQQQTEQGKYVFPKPRMYEFSLSESELLYEYLSLFEKLGFVIEPFKDTTFRVSAVPLLFQDRNHHQLLSEMLEDLQRGIGIKEVDKISQRMIAYLACRGAIKAGERLTKKQAKDLIEKLDKTPNKTTCPHGRPTTVMVDVKKIHAMFKRK